MKIPVLWKLSVDQKLAYKESLSIFLFLSKAQSSIANIFHVAVVIIKTLISIKIHI